MKKLLSLLLIAALIISAVAVFPLTASAGEAVFAEGDVLYLRIKSPSNWAENCRIYANFTDASREDNGGSSVTISTADPAKYAPVQGVNYITARGLYRYTISSADAGATAMRFWRGNEDTLWNCSVVLTAADFADGKNTVIVTDWTDTGYLDTTYAFSLNASLSLSSTEGEVGDSFDIEVIHSCPDTADFACELMIDDTVVSTDTSYTFTPEEGGVYTVTANLTARHPQTGALQSAANLTALITVGTRPVTAASGVALYVHAARGTEDTETWVKWYGVNGVYYFFMPSSLKPGDPVEIYSTYPSDGELDSLTIPAKSVTQFTPEADADYLFRQGRTTRTVKFLYSSAESALFVNNTDDFNGDDFFTYLQADKRNSVAASGACVDADGTLTNAAVKKMKGRGNTSWNADKKGFNVTFTDTISVAGMEKGKKFSLISNFQDAALLRNRILYDLSDAVGVPYASDSRMIDLYTNGVYQGSYQICQKIEVGKNTLMPDISDSDYLNKKTDEVKADFSFVIEIDSSPAEDDFHFTASNGNSLTVSCPELDADDPHLPAVRDYIKSKYDAMVEKLRSGAADAGDYIDLDSLAKVYLINELGKNWDSGATSFFLVYKPDANGAYKFFASPVWDYDNSLGNARGIDGDLERMHVSDYTLPTGWFSTRKNGYNGPNFLATAIKNSAVKERVYTVWFESFVPALAILTQTGVKEGELYSADVYYDIVKDSAEMNYRVWPLLTNTHWIADHSSLLRYRAAYTYGEDSKITGVTVTPFDSAAEYDQDTFDGQFNYMLDWLTSRAAWISGQYIAHYSGGSSGDLFGDVDLSGDITVFDATAIQRYLVSLEELSDRQLALADTDHSGAVDITDATMIQRYLVGLDDLTP